MRVHVVLESSHDGDLALGAYESKSDAEAVCAELEANPKKDEHCNHGTCYFSYYIETVELHPAADAVDPQV